MSTDTAVPRTRVLRGAAAAAIRGVAMGADLSLLRPLTGGVLASAEQAEEAARAVRHEASRVGYEDGYAAGLAAAADAARAAEAAAIQRVDTAVATLAAAAAELTARQTIVVADVEQRVAEVATQIAAAILQRELAACDSPVLDAVTRALRLAPPRVDAVARLHPEDAAAVAALATVAHDRDVTVIPDASVERGGCVLDVGPCRIDAQITPALERVREVLQS